MALASFGLGVVFWGLVESGWGLDLRGVVCCLVGVWSRFPVSPFRQAALVVRVSLRLIAFVLGESGPVLRWAGEGVMVGFVVGGSCDLGLAADDLGD